MLVTNGTRHAGAAYGFGAPLGAGGGRILSGPFRGQSVGNNRSPTILPARGVRQIHLGSPTPPKGAGAAAAKSREEHPCL